MSECTGRVLLVCCVVALVCGVTHAEVEGRPWAISMDVSGQYTDNRDSAPVNEQSNFDLYLRPRLDVFKYTDQSRYDIYYIPEFRFRSDPVEGQDDTELFHDLGVEVKHLFSERTTGRISDRFRYTDDSSAKSGGSTVRSNENYIQNRLDALLNFDVMEYSNLDLWGTWYFRDYEEDLPSVVSDEDLIRLQAMLRWQLNDTLSSILMLRGDAYTYDHTSVDRDSSSFLGAAGLRNSFSDLLSGSLMVGAQMRSYSDSTIAGDGDTLPYGKFTVEYRTMATTRFDLVGSLGLRDSDVYPFASQEYADITLGADWENEGRNWLIDGDLGYRTSSYDEDQLPSSVDPTQLPATEGDENTTTVSAGVRYKFVDHASVAFRQLYEKVDSEVASSYTKNTSVLSVNMDF